MKCVNAKSLIIIRLGDSSRISTSILQRLGSIMRRISLLSRPISTLVSCSDLKLIHEVISQEEESVILRFLEKVLSRKRYEGNHWDDVIQQYKELELSNYKVPSDVTEVLTKVQSTVRSMVGKPYEFLPPHVIELADNGYIGPHVDSVKFSGGFVAGLSLLSTRVMRLSLSTGDSRGMTTASSSDSKVGTKPLIEYEKNAMGQLKYASNITVNGSGMHCYVGSASGLEGEGSRSSRSPLVRQPPYPGSPVILSSRPEVVELVLPPRSLYVLMGPWRYNYDHAVLGVDQQPAQVAAIPDKPSRRISIIFRDAKDS